MIMPLTFIQPLANIICFFHIFLFVSLDKRRRKKYDKNNTFMVKLQLKDV